jgi:uncharacterized peroxidase-related enzyme
MSRIATPQSIETSPAGSQPLLQAVQRQLGSVPNLFRVVGNSPAALEGYLGLNNALSKGVLNAKTRERLALTIAEQNSCGYCLAAHTYLGKNMAHLDEQELSANRRGRSSDPKAEAALQFAAEILANRGHASEEGLAAIRHAGYGDAELVEIVAHVALNTLTNYINSVALTEVDFPVVVSEAAA